MEKKKKGGAAKIIIVLTLLLTSVLFASLYFSTEYYLRDTQSKLAQLKVPDSESIDESTGIVYLLWSSKAYETLEDAFAEKNEIGKLAEPNIMSRIAAQSKLVYLQDKTMGLGYSRIIIQKSPRIPEKKVYQVGDIFVVSAKK